MGKTVYAAFCHRPTIWQRLGFGTCRAPIPEDLEGWAPSYLAVEAVTDIDWRDRLRILISGKVMLSTHIKTDVTVGKAAPVSAFSVLPPNFK